MKPTAFYLAFAAAAMLFAASQAYAGQQGRQQSPPLPVVENVDLAKYAGRYYEIALIPNSFQESCVGGTTATYSLREDGDMNVVNSCYDEDGELIEAKGIAWIPDQSEPAKLKVSFIPFGLKLFGGDYWITMLASDYSYAVIAHPERKYGWILARENKLPPATMNEIRLILFKTGYNFDDFVMTDQTNYPPATE